MTLLARRVYNEDIATLLTDNGNGTTDFKQKSLCDYCHMASSQDATHNNGTANVFPSATYAKRYQDGGSDSGTLASYDGGASGTCAADFAEGTDVSLTASAASGSDLTHVL